MLQGTSVYLGSWGLIRPAFALCRLCFEDGFLKKPKQMFRISTQLLQHHEGWLLLAYCSVVLLKMQDNCRFISSTFLALVLGLSYKHLLITLSVSFTIVRSGPGWNLYDALSGHLYVHSWLIFWGVILVWSSLTCFACVIVRREATSGNSVSSLLSEVWYVFFGPVCFLHDCCMRLS